MEKYANLYLEYSLQGKLADDNYVIEIINIAKSNGYITNSVNNIEQDKYATNGAYYSPKSKTIGWVPTLMEKHTFVQFDKNIKNKNSLEYIFYYNYEILTAILHEIEHANQYEMSKSKEDSIEAQICKLDYKLIDDAHFINIIRTIKNGLHRTKKYEYSPIERMAELSMREKIFGILDFVFALDDLDFKMLDAMHINNMKNMMHNRKRGYDILQQEIYKGALLLYFEGSYIMKKLKKLDIYDEDLKQFLKNAASRYV